MGIHWTELVVVAFVALLIFGPTNRSGNMRTRSPV